MKAGIYLVKDNISEKKYIVSVNGKEPFLKVSNAIELSSFANGVLSKNNDFIQKILENPSNFEFNLLSKEIEQNEVPSILPREFNISITDEQYEKIISNTENIDEMVNIPIDFRSSYYPKYENVRNFLWPCNVGTRWDEASFVLGGESMNDSRLGITSLRKKKLY